MDLETLVTFHFKAPPEIRTVELLGSWDNFSRPYAMFHDRRRGVGFWSGCFEFQDIVFDGVDVNWSRPRTGGLKQGGTYWYYFRLDDVVEAYDDLRERTTACPLMPGQMVNVMFVPREVQEPPVTNRCAGVNSTGALARIEETHMLEPGARLAALEPPALSKVHAGCVSDLALNGRLEGRPTSRRLGIESPRSASGTAGIGATDVKPATSARLGDSSCEPLSGSNLIPPAPSPMCEVLAPPLLHPVSGHPSRPPTRHAEPAGVIQTISSPSVVKFLEPNSLEGVKETATGQCQSNAAVETSSPRPHSVADVHFHSDPTDDRSSRGRHYSLHNADLIPQLQPTYATCSTSLISPVYSPVNTGSPIRSGSPAQHLETSFSPAYTATTASSSGGEINTPFYLGAVEAERDPRAKTAWVTEDSFEDVAARLRSLEQQTPLPLPSRQPPPHSVQTYRPTGFTEVASRTEVPRSYALPVRNPMIGSSWADADHAIRSGNGADTFALPFLAAGRGLGQEMSMADSIFNELGYLGGAIR